MPTLEEMGQALAGLLRLALFDRSGVQSFGRDLDACRRSFAVYLVGLPLFLLVDGIAALGSSTETPALFTAAQLIGNVIETAGFLLLLRPLLSRFGRAERWAWFVTGYNWYSIGQITLFVALLGLAPGLPSGALRLLFGAFHVYALVVEAFLADAILEIGGLRAAAIVLLDVLFSLGIDLVADQIGGG